MPGDISFYTCPINENHIMYGSCDTEHDRHDFLLFWVIFCRFWGGPGDIIIWHYCTKNHDHILHCSVCKITFEHWACQTNLAQCLIEKQFLLLNGQTVSVENLFVVKLEESHKNSIYLFIFWLKVIIQHY